MTQTDDLKNSGLILIVEDDEEIFNDLKTCLEQSGYKVDQVFLGDYDRIMGRIDRIDPILLFVDIDLKDPQGRTGIELVREQRKRRSIPIIILSDKIKQKDFKAQTARLGVDGFLSKPWNCEAAEVAADLALDRYRKVRVITEIHGDIIDQYLEPFDISYITSDGGKRSLVYTIDGEEFSSPRSLAQHLRRLNNDTFMKVNRSHIVNFGLEYKYLLYGREKKTLLVGSMRKEIKVGDDYGETVRARLERRHTPIKHPKKKKED